MNKETALLLIAFIWGVYSIVIGLFTVLYGYNNDLVWISIITAISGTTGAHAAISLSNKGLSVKTSGPPQELQKEKVN